MTSPSPSGAQAPASPLSPTSQAELPIRRCALLVLGIVSVVQMVIVLGLGLLPEGLLDRRSEAVVDCLLLALISYPVMWVYLVRPLRRAQSTDREAILAYQERILRQSREREFESRYNAALEMVDAESDVIDVAHIAVAQTLPGMGFQLLLADNSRAHLRPVIDETQGRSRPCGCAVDQPMDCVAVRRGRPMAFPSDREIDACPRLRGRVDDPIGALCIPVTIGGRAIGVIHAPHAQRQRPSESAARTLETLAALTGARIGMLRVLARTQLQAETDPLTGLLNRRSLETHTNRAIESGEPFAVVACDLDHFKLLNDTHGHEAGDRALRLFSRTLRDAVRPQDLVARLGGEEFVVVLPGCSMVDAAAIAARVGKALCANLARGTVPAFTASFGVADSSQGRDLAKILPLADTALYAAKRSGRNRVMVASLESDDGAVESETQAVLDAQPDATRELRAP